MVGTEETIWGTFPHPFSEILSVGKKEVGQEKETQKEVETERTIPVCRMVMA